MSLKSPVFLQASSVSSSDNAPPEEHNAHSRYRADIDGLRALAILSVVIFHAFPSVLRGGFVGVDVFFVISGFLISGIIFKSLQRGGFSFAEFYAHRIKRIFPALTIVLTSCYAFGWFVLLPNEFKQLGKHIAAGAGFVQNFVLWSEVGYFDTAAELKPLLHLWSLAIEEQFYLFYPLLVFIVWRAGLNVLLLVLLLGLLSFAFNVMNVVQSPVSTFFMPQTRFWELLAGALLAYLQLPLHGRQGERIPYLPFYLRLFHEASRPRWPQCIHNWVSALGLLLVVAAVLRITRNDAFPGWWALAPVVGTFLLIFAGPSAWVNRVILSNKLVVFVGLISYPLYLWHWPILAFARIMAEGMPAAKSRIAAVAVSFILAWLTYRLIERPVRFGRKTWTRTAIPTLALTLIGFIGYNAFQRDGLAFRIPGEVRHIVNSNYEYAKDARVGKCWLSAEQAPDGFASECIEAPSTAASPSLLVWGDSHAARLYPGLRSVSRDRIVLSQLTRDGCPPILGFGYPTCQKSNEYVISQIGKLAPTTVVMYAVWSNYGTDWRTESLARQGLLESIRRLKALGIRNIVVLGPAPYWNEVLPKLVYKAWGKSLSHSIPDRLATGMKPEVREVDMQLADILTSLSIRYVSVWQLLCSEDGCLTHVPGSAQGLTTWDYGHLTTEGAVFVSQQLALAGVLP